MEPNNSQYYPLNRIKKRLISIDNKILFILYQERTPIRRFILRRKLKEIFGVEILNSIFERNLKKLVENNLIEKIIEQENGRKSYYNISKIGEFQLLNPDKSLLKKKIREVLKESQIVEKVKEFFKDLETSYEKISDLTLSFLRLKNELTLTNLNYYLHAFYYINLNSINFKKNKIPKFLSLKNYLKHVNLDSEVQVKIQSKINELVGIPGRFILFNKTILLDQQFSDATFYFDYISNYHIINSIRFEVKKYLNAIQYDLPKPSSIEEFCEKSCKLIMNTDYIDYDIYQYLSWIVKKELFTMKSFETIISRACGQNIEKNNLFDTSFLMPSTFGLDVGPFFSKFISVLQELPNKKKLREILSRLNNDSKKPDVLNSMIKIYNEEIKNEEKVTDDSLIIALAVLCTVAHEFNLALTCIERLNLNNYENPIDLIILFIKGRIYHLKREFGKGEIIYNNIIQKDEGFYPAKLFLAKLCMDRNRNYNAKCILEELSYLSNNITYLCFKGQCYYQERDYNNALECFNKVFLINSKCKIAHLFMGATHNERNEPKKALRYLNQANLKENPFWCLIKAESLIKVGNSKKSLELINDFSAMEKTPYLKKVGQLKKIEILRKVSPFKALKYLEELLSENPGNHWFWYLKSTIFRKLKKNKKALECMENAYNIDPNSQCYHLSYIDLLEINEQYLDAIKLFDDYQLKYREISCEINEISYLLHKTELQLKLPNPEKWIKQIKTKIKKLTPTNSMEFWEIAEIYKRINNKTEAIMYYKQAIELNDSSLTIGSINWHEYLLDEYNMLLNTTGNR